MVNCVLSRSKRHHRLKEFRLWYYEDAELVGSHKLPQLAPQRYVPHDVRSWSERSSLRDLSNYWLDFFADDRVFAPLWNAFVNCVAVDDPELEKFWRQLDGYSHTLKRAAGVIGTDYSMLPMMLPDQRNWNCARNRIVSFYLERLGIPTIPVASWCDRTDFDWCFDGLPENSTIAISTNGCLSTVGAKMVLLEGIEELVSQKSPWLLVVCGRELPQIADICSNVLYYPSYSQRMQGRIKNGR